MADKYTLSYLPMFYDDLEEKVAYLSDVLLNPEAANNLLDAVEKAILERMPNAESFEKYRSLRSYNIIVITGTVPVHQVTSYPYSLRVLSGNPRNMGLL